MARQKKKKPIPRKSRHLSKKQFEISKELRELGELFSSHLERKGRGAESWWHRTLGIVGPFVHALFGLAVLMIAVGALNFINVYVGSGFVASISLFLLSNLPLFLGIFTFFSYSSYMYRKHSAGYRPFSPLIKGFEISIGFWVASMVINLINPFLGMGFLGTAAFFIQSKMTEIFVFFVVAGYIIFFLRTATNQERVEKEKTVKLLRKTRWEPMSLARANNKGFCRSGRNRVIGGVCGGVAEYFKISMFAVRAIWVLSILLWGFGLLAYAVMWVLMPRNPAHRWK